MLWITAVIWIFNECSKITIRIKVCYQDSVVVDQYIQ